MADADSSPLHAYFLRAAKNIFREPHGCLRHPYVVPGGLYAEQLWDWDSFWVVKGLREIARHADGDFHARLLRHGVGSWQNFFANQASNGAVPLLIEPERPDVFDCARDDGTRNQAKPVLAQFALELVEMSGETAWLEPHFDGLLRFLDRWAGRYGHASGLLVWGSDLAIGTDNDPAIFGRPEFSAAGLLLNSLHVRELLAAARLASQLGRPADAETLRARAAAAAESVRRECWDPVDEIFYTVDVHCEDHRDRYVPPDFPKGMAMAWRTLPLKLKGFSAFAPLWAGIATRAQAEALVRRHWQGSDLLNARWGVRTLARNERMYAPGVDSANPSNWLGPIWIVANYMTWDALARYGFATEADALAQKTTELLLADLERTGTLHECYHPDTGAPNFNADFFSWNCLALAMARPVPIIA
jgi:putative isomerase